MKASKKNLSVIFALTLALSACVPISAFAAGSSTNSIRGSFSFSQTHTAADNEAAQGSDFYVDITLPEGQSSEGLNVYKAKLDFDSDIFDAISQNNFAANGTWTHLRFNPENNEMIVVSKKPVEENRSVASVRLPVKKDAMMGETRVNLLNVQSSDGETDNVEPIAELPVTITKALEVSRPEGGTGGVGVTGGTGSSGGWLGNIGNWLGNIIGGLGGNAGGAGNTGGTSGAGQVSNPHGTVPVGSQVPTGSSPQTQTDWIVTYPSTNVAGATPQTSVIGGLSKTGDSTGAAVLITVLLLACIVAAISKKEATADPKTARTGNGLAKRAIDAAESHSTAILAAAVFACFAIIAALAIAHISSAELAFAEDAADEPIDPAYDINGDGKVNGKDIVLVEDMLIGLQKPAVAADINHDNMLTLSDLSLLVTYRFSLPDADDPEDDLDDPGTTEDPSDVTDPGDPAEPDDPDDPNSPVNPGEDDPAEPEDPSNPAEPEDPSDPSNPSDPSDPDNPSDPHESLYEFPQMTPSDGPVTYTEFQMATDAMAARGIYGDHSQWITGMEISKDGALMLVGTDCCGLYRSLDRGKTWDQANIGFNSRSSSCFAIDPYNSDHAVVIGGSRSGDGIRFGGIYQTFDAAQSWTQSEITTTTGSAFYTFGNRYDWDGFQFDPTTYDATAGITTDVYLSTPYMRDVDIREHAGKHSTNLQTKLKREDAGLYKSTDGGSTFVHLNDNIYLTDGIVEITSDGKLYIGNEYGLFEVDKNTGDIVNSFFLNTNIDGTTVKKNWVVNNKRADFTVDNFNMGVTGFDVVNDVLYVQTWDGIYTAVSPTSDDDFTQITDTETYPDLWPQLLAVSPVDPDFMMMQTRRRLDMYYHNFLWYTHDGGKTWTMSEYDKESIFSSPTDWDSIERIIVFDPQDPNRVTVNGNGVVTQSTDKGLNFIQTNGISNLMAGSKFTMNYYNPDIITFGAQDFTGAISENGGRTWRQLRAYKDGDTTRSIYAAYSPDGQTIFGWGANKYGSGFSLMVSHDGNGSWVDTELKTEVPYQHGFCSLQSYNDPKILLSNEWRSTDGGLTWEKMDGCLCAFTINYTGKHEIYGYNSVGNPVVSWDDGASWEILYEGNISSHGYLVKGSERPVDMAYDHVNNILYIADRFSTTYNNGVTVNQGACRVVRLPLDDPSKKKDLNIKYYAGYSGIRSIAIDPNCTSVLYVAGSADSCSNPTALYRSIDGGDTFSNLTSSRMYDGNGELIPTKATNQGGYEANVVRVDPITGRCLIGTNCYGFEWINPPYDSSLLNHKR